MPRYRQLCPTRKRYDEIEAELPPALRLRRLAEDRPTMLHLRMLEVVGRHRYALADHVKALLGGNPRWIDGQLQALFHHGYLSRLVRYRRQRVGLDVGSEKVAYALDSRGHRALEEARSHLADELGTEVAGVAWNKSWTRRGELFVEHQLALTTFRATLELALRGRGELQLAEWVPEEALRDEFRYRNVNTGAVVKEAIRPDAFFVVLEHGRPHPFFLEIDMGTEDHSVLLGRMQAHYNYAHHPKFLERYARARPEGIRVLWVCKDAGKATRSHLRREKEAVTRFERMFQTLEAVRGNRDQLRKLFWFTRLDAYRLEEPALILGSIWRRRGMTEGNGHTLFGPPATS